MLVYSKKEEIKRIIKINKIKKLATLKLKNL